MGPATTDPYARASLPRVVVVLVGIAAAVVSLVGIREFSGIIGPAFLALVIVVTLDPIRGWLVRRGMPEWAGVAGLLLATYATLIALVASLLYAVGRLGLLLPDYASRVSDLAAQVAGALEPIGLTRDQLVAILDDVDLSTFVGSLRPVLGGATSAASSLLLVAVLVLFLGLESATFERRFGATAIRPSLVEALAAFVRRTRQYVMVSTVFGLIVAAVDTAVLFWIGVPLPLVWGVLAFVTNYVPNVGFVLGLAPPALIALLDGGVGPMLAVVIAYCVANFAIQSLIQPKVVGDAVGLSAAVTFLSLVFWAIVLGALGGLLAVPLTLLVKAVFVDADPGARWLGPLVGDRDLAGAGAAGLESSPPESANPVTPEGVTSAAGHEAASAGPMDAAGS